MTQGHRTTNVRRWNRDKIIAAIQERQRLGLKLTDVAKLDVGLFSAACRHFGNWANAVKAAGLTPAFPKWSQQRVLEVIRRHQQQGLSLTGIWSSDRPLYLAARRHFGSWQSALAAAGLPTTRRQKWSRERVVGELRTWHRGHGGNIRQQNGRLASATTKYFGSLQNALRASGLESRRVKWTKQRVIEAIQNRHVRRSVIGRDVALESAAARRFGSWHAALRAAGLEPRMMERWTADRVLKQIRSRFERGLSLTNVWTQDGRLFAAGIRYFGGWPKAVAAAGLAEIAGLSKRKLTPMPSDQEPPRVTSDSHPPDRPARPTATGAKRRSRPA